MNACEPRRQGAGTAILMAVVGALTAVTLWGLHGERLFAVNVVTAIVGWALLPLLARRPVATTIMLNVLAALSPAATPAATVGTLQVAQRRPLGTAVRVGLVGIAAHAVRGLLQPTPALPYGWWLVLVVIAHAALVAWGALTQARAALIGTLRERADRAEAEQGRRVAEARALERHRIAREMHDVLAHR
ncbi:MAG: sensor histidine kinase, partial [Streptosporangiaceae bacterium]